MKVTVTIERDEGDDDSTTMGITSSGIEQMDVFRMLLAGAEMTAYGMVRDGLIANGATPEEAEYAAPLRTRLLALEVIVGQEVTPYSWVALNLDLGLEES